MKLREIPQFPFSAYRVDMSWKTIKNTFDRYNENYGVILQPSFQRGHVWKEDQKSKYIEYCLRGGEAAREILFNCPSWMDKFNHPLECIDGQQRINAVLDFLNDKVKAFGNYYSEFEDELTYMSQSFSFRVFKIKDRKELIEFYISLNIGGSYHTETDLMPAYEELEKLKNNS